MFLRVRPFLYPGALVVLAVFWLALTPALLQLYAEFWPEAMTMVLGAFVAGSTPLGGGAVAFPVLTKFLEVSINDARHFSLLIQSIGMTAATLLFVGMGARIYWPVIARALPISVGVAIAIPQLFPELGGHASSVFFLFECLALIVIALSDHSNSIHDPDGLPQFWLICCSAIGGALTGLLGSGADLLIFIYLTQLLRIAPASAIPTSVAFMALNAMILAIYKGLHTPPSEYVMHAWMAAIPVVAIAAPCGAWLIQTIRPHWVTGFVIALIIFDTISSLIMGKVVSTIAGSFILAAVLVFLLVDHFSPHKQDF